MKRENVEMVKDIEKLYMLVNFYKKTFVLIPFLYFIEKT